MIQFFVLFILASSSEGATTTGPDARANCPSQLARTKDLLVYKDVCLQFVHDIVNWEASKLQCENRGGYLVTIEDAAKQQFIENALTTLRWKYISYGVWIGANDRETETVWKWMNGQVISYGNWQIGQGPGHTGTGFLFATGVQEDCGIIRISDNFKWHDFPCADQFHKYTSICEYKMTGTNVETPAPTQPNIETPAPTQPNIETPAPTQPNIETPAPTQPNIETPAPTQPNRETPAPNRETPAPTQPNIETPAPNRETPAPTQPNRETPAPNRETPAPTQPNRETPAPTMQVIIG